MDKLVQRVLYVRNRTINAGYGSCAVNEAYFKYTLNLLFNKIDFALELYSLHLCQIIVSNYKNILSDIHLQGKWKMKIKKK